MSDEPKMAPGLVGIVVAWLFGVVGIFVLLFFTGILGVCHSPASREWIVPIVSYTWLWAGIVGLVIYVRRALKQKAKWAKDPKRDIVAEMRRELRLEKEGRRPD